MTRAQAPVSPIGWRAALRLKGRRSHEPLQHAEADGGATRDGAVVVSSRREMPVRTVGRRAGSISTPRIFRLAQDDKLSTGMSAIPRLRRYAAPLGMTARP